MTSYIQKIRVPVRVSQAGLAPIEGFLSLGPQAEFHAGPETVLELLNAPNRSIPLQRAPEGRTLLLNRTDIEWVATNPEVAPSLICPPNYQITSEEQVSIRFRGGNRIDGRVQMELPEHLNRASDYMNGVEDFFPLMTPFGVLVVSKLAVSSCELHSASPSPPFADQSGPGRAASAR